MKTIILGMNHPKSGSGEPLELTIPGSSGARLLAISGLSREVFESCFERLNVLNKQHWDLELAGKRARRFARRLSGRSIVCLGKEVWRSLGHVEIGWGESISLFGNDWFLIPHPSGRNRFYNIPSQVELARATLIRAATVPTRRRTT